MGKFVVSRCWLLFVFVYPATVLLVRFSRESFDASNPEHVASLGRPQSSKFADDYVLGARIGEGGYSVVYEGAHKASRELVAVKCVEKKRLSAHEKRGLIEEVKVMRKVCRWWQSWVSCRVSHPVACGHAWSPAPTSQHSAPHCILRRTWRVLHCHRAYDRWRVVRSNRPKGRQQHGLCKKLVVCVDAL